MEFKLETFEGPLDLLLYLVNRHKLNIYDIEISLLLDQYLEYMDNMQEQDLDQAGEFLAMAARLIYIKTCSLLPKAEEAEELKKELEGELIEYSLIKEAAANLREICVYGDVFVRPPEKLPVNKVFTGKMPPEKLLKAYLGMSAKARRMKPVRAETFSPIVSARIVTVTSKIVHVLKMLYTLGRCTMAELYEGVEDKSARVATFLAVLELTKSGRVKLNEDNTEITFNRDAPRRKKPVPDKSAEEEPIDDIFADEEAAYDYEPEEFAEDDEAADNTDYETKESRYALPGHYLWQTEQQAVQTAAPERFERAGGLIENAYNITKATESPALAETRYLLWKTEPQGVQTAAPERFERAGERTENAYNITKVSKSPARAETRYLLWKTEPQGVQTAAPERFERAGGLTENAYNITKATENSARAETRFSLWQTEQQGVQTAAPERFERAGERTENAYNITEVSESPALAETRYPLWKTEPRGGLTAAVELLERAKEQAENDIERLDRTAVTYTPEQSAVLEKTNVTYDEPQKYEFVMIPPAEEKAAVGQSETADIEETNKPAVTALAVVRESKYAPERFAGERRAAESCMTAVVDVPLAEEVREAVLPYIAEEKPQTEPSEQICVPPKKAAERVNLFACRWFWGYPVKGNCFTFRRGRS